MDNTFPFTRKHCFLREETEYTTLYNDKMTNILMKAGQIYRKYPIPTVNNYISEKYFSLMLQYLEEYYEFCEEVKNTKDVFEKAINIMNIASSEAVISNLKDDNDDSFELELKLSNLFYELVDMMNYMTTMINMFVIETEVQDVYYDKILKEHSFTTNYYYTTKNTIQDYFMCDTLDAVYNNIIKDFNKIGGIHNSYALYLTYIRRLFPERKYHKPHTPYSKEEVWNKIGKNFMDYTLSTYSEYFGMLIRLKYVLNLLNVTNILSFLNKGNDRYGTNINNTFKDIVNQVFNNILYKQELVLEDKNYH